MNASPGSRGLQSRAVSLPTRRGSPRTIALRSMEVARTAPAFHVGDRVEYWSDTYRQWMPGVVQRVKDGGQLFDLDVKKGAQVSKLRANRSAPGRCPQPPPELAAPREPTAAAATSREEVLTALQAKQISAELSRVTRAIQGHVDSTDVSGQDVVSRAGAVTVRKMVETTKALLQGLEGALILRAGFIASCFHMWRSETTLARAGRVYQDEFHRHHNEWNEHVEQMKRHYEFELQRLQMVALQRKDRVARQQNLVLDRWSHGDETGLIHQFFYVWREFTCAQYELRRRSQTVQLLVNEWAEGSDRGLLHSSYRTWRELAAQELRIRLHDEERRRYATHMEGQMKSLQQRKDAELLRALEDVERRKKDRTRSVELVLAKWQRGSAEGLLAAVTQGWLRLVQRSRQRQPLDVVVRRSAVGSDTCLMASTLRAWSAEAGKLAHARALSEHRNERRLFEKVLAEAQKAHGDLRQEHLAVTEKRKLEAKALVEYILRKWELDSVRGTLKELVLLWRKHAQQVRAAASRRRAVHCALIRSLEGERRAGRHIAYLTWKHVVACERHARELEQRKTSSEVQLRSFLSETQAQHDAKYAVTESSATAIRARARQVAQCSVRRWILGDRRALVSSVVFAWRAHAANLADRARKRAAVKDQLLLSVEGSRRGTLHMAFLEWMSFSRMEHARQADRIDKDSKVAALEKRVEAMVSREARKLEKYGEMLGSKQGRELSGVAFSAWRTQCGGLATELERARERAVAVEELERQRQMAEALHQERRARALSAIVCRRSAVLCGVVFAVWLCLWQQKVDAREQRLNKNKAMLQYSELVIGQKLKKDSASLLAFTFAEWRREAKALHHQLHTEGTQQHLSEAHGLCARLEAENRELQEQLDMYYQQIDHITDTLQKELKTKEEMALELQRAYRMRRTIGAQVGAPRLAASTGPPPISIEERLGALFRTNSEQTLHDETLAFAGGGSGNASSSRRASSPGSAPDLAPPHIQELPFGRRADEVEAVLSQEAAMEADDGDDHGRSPSCSAVVASEADAMFGALDRNHDGVITRAEMREAYRAGRKY